MATGDGFNQFNQELCFRYCPNYATARETGQAFEQQLKDLGDTLMTARAVIYDLRAELAAEKETEQQLNRDLSNAISKEKYDSMVRSRAYWFGEYREAKGKLKAARVTIRKLKVCPRLERTTCVSPVAQVMPAYLL